MNYRPIAMLALLAGPLAACAGSGPQVYPQPYISKATAVQVTPESQAAFKARTIVTPPHGKVQDLAEAYIASSVAHPSSAKFTGAFESDGKSVALCGFVTYRDKHNTQTAWRPFFVEWTSHHTKGVDAPYYDPDEELAKLCGPMTPPAE
ncbi:hypothetical protein ACELLULO517_15140 [Acidisoma cellulosilytica]|uniref:Uncharacterized protein n=1 Tax=Acidisoma cellulosilyticum TaxID=2802395 RepID=A0A964E536_9PROT|nr:hypothetical protein [Acidisoma cellulosilyticum]MCB8881583.1 hypothetical protein [Acidisoma cellulosilyticum]